MTDLIVIRKSKLSQSPNQKDDIYQEINEKPVFRVSIFFLNPQSQSCTSGRDRELGCYYMSWGFPGGSAVKNPSANMGDVGSVPKSGRSPGEGKGYPLQYSGLENTMDYSPWGCRVGRN